jgi:hypothetical protein
MGAICATSVRQMETIDPVRKASRQPTGSGAICDHAH